jgi:hypothetical protein
MRRSYAMITLEPPHMGINDIDTHMKVQMMYNLDVMPGHAAAQIIIYVRTLAEKIEKFKNVVFSCHGGPGYLLLGGKYITSREIGLFFQWRDRVEKIWFHGCNVAKGSDGHSFCSQIAQVANCYVVAPTEFQVDRPRTFPYGQLGTFEGLLLSYSPNGSISWQHRYASTYRRPDGSWAHNPD